MDRSYSYLQVLVTWRYGFLEKPGELVWVFRESCSRNRLLERFLITMSS